MPALRAWISKLSLLLLCVLLTACDRHNDISEPAGLIKKAEIVCEWESKFPVDIDYIQGVTIDNIYEDAAFSQDFEFSTDIYEYTLHTGYMVRSTSFNVNTIVVSEYAEELAALVIDINNERLTENNVVFETELAVGSNEIIMEVTATRIEYLKKSSDEEVNDFCGYPSQRVIDRAIENGNPSPVPTRRVDDYFEYTFTIVKQSMEQLREGFSLLSSDVISSLDANDSLGSQVLIGSVFIDRELGTTQDILLVGVPHEDSNARGVIPVSELGSQGQDNSAPDSGAVYIYKRTATGDWAFSHYLKAPNANSGDQFGSALALHDNLLVVSALGEDSQASGINGHQDNNLAPDSGAVYVYEFLEQDVWRFRSFIKKPLNSIGIDGYNDAFGTALSFESDTLLVSAPKEDSPDGRGINPSLPNSGAVYLYKVARDITGNFASFAYEETFKAPHPNDGDFFGTSLDLNAVATSFVVGAIGESSDFRDILDLTTLETDSPENSFLLSNAARNSGAVYMFRKTDLGAWSGEASLYIKSPNGEEGDLFGVSLEYLSENVLLVGASMEDSDGDGFNRNMQDNSAPNSGAVYLFARNDDEIWNFEHFIKAPVSSADEHFGSDLASYNKNFVVSAPETLNESQMFSGQVYGYEFDQTKSFNNELLHFLTLNGDDPDMDSANERYGRTLSLFGPILAVGAPGLTNESQGQQLEQAGGVFLYQ